MGIFDAITLKFCKGINIVGYNVGASEISHKCPLKRTEM